MNHRIARGRRAQASGVDAEALACAALERDGWTVLGRRLRTPAGEIDAVAEKDGLLVFLEVKHRPDLALAAYALSPRQQARLLAAAEILLASQPGLGTGGNAVRRDAGGWRGNGAPHRRRVPPGGIGGPAPGVEPFGFPRHCLQSGGSVLWDVNTVFQTRASVEGRVSTGIAGLDDILGGGLPANRVYLIEGEPGTGKTTLALQFLLAGRECGERGLYVTLSESEEELRVSAASHGWSLDGLDLFQLVSDTVLDPEAEQIHPPPLRAGTGRDQPWRDGDGGWLQSGARGVRQPVRNAAAGTEPAALSPPDAGVEAVLRPAPLHRAAAGRQNAPSPAICNCTASPTAS